MNKVLKNNKFLILRRIIQISILLLFVGGNYWGWNILKGDLSTAKVLDTFYLSDPYFVIQTFASGFVVATDVWFGQ